MFDIVLLGLEKSRGVVVNGDGSDFVAHAIELAAALTRVVFASDLLHDVHSIGHLTEDRMPVVEERSGDGGDEKLGSVGARAGIGHRENAGCAVTEVRVELIGKLVARATAAGFSRVSALQHETFDYPVEGHVVVVSAAGEIEETGAREGHLGRVKRGIDVSGGGVKCDFDVGHGGRKHRISTHGNTYPTGCVAPSQSPDPAPE
jgi:hypothetical protein